MKCGFTPFRGGCGEVVAVIRKTSRATGTVTERPACNGHALASMKYCRNTWSTTITERVAVGRVAV